MGAAAALVAFGTPVAAAPVAAPHFVRQPVAHSHMTHRGGLTFVNLTVVVRFDRALDRKHEELVAAPAMSARSLVSAVTFAGLTPVAIGGSDRHCYVAEPLQLHVRRSLASPVNWRLALAKAVVQGEWLQRTSRMVVRRGDGGFAWQKRAARSLGCR